MTAEFKRPLDVLGGDSFTMHQAALAYAANGIAVFPCREKPGDRGESIKAPYFDRSDLPNGLKDATTSLLQITAWWTRWPNALIGSPVREGEFCLDMDPRHGAHLDDLFDAPPSTRTAWSGGPDTGRHFYFAAPDGVEFSQSALHTWISQRTGRPAKVPDPSGATLPSGEPKMVDNIGWDLRLGGAHYLIMPPSVHPESGRPYVWDGAAHEAAPLPAPLVEACRKAGPSPALDRVPPPRTSVDLDRRGTSGSPHSDYNATHTISDLLEPAGWVIKRGDGNSEGSMWQHPTATAEHSASVRGGRLYNYSTGTGMPVAGTREGGLSPFDLYVHLHHGGDEKAALDAIRESARPVDEPDSTNAEEFDAEAVRERFPRLDWHALWADDTEEEWIVEPLLPARRLVALYSLPKLGKSLLMLEIAVAVSLGRMVLGTTPPRPFRVLYVDFENDPRSDVKKRLQSMGYSPYDLDGLDYLSFPTMSGLDSPAGGAELMNAVKAYGSEVVVIDTVSRAVNGPENDNDTWLLFYRKTGVLLKRAGIALIRLDHAGKDETKGQRGGSAKAGDVDAVWRLSCVTKDKTFRLDCEANRMPVTEQTIVLHRELSPVLHHRVDALGRIASFGIEVQQLVEALDAAGLPDNIGRPGAREALRGSEIKASNDALGSAIAARKARNNCPDSTGAVSGPMAVPDSPGQPSQDGTHKVLDLDKRLSRTVADSNKPRHASTTVRPNLSTVRTVGQPGQDRRSEEEKAPRREWPDTSAPEPTHVAWVEVAHPLTGEMLRREKVKVDCTDGPRQMIVWRPEYGTSDGARYIPPRSQAEIDRLCGSLAAPGHAEGCSHSATS